MSSEQHPNDKQDIDKYSMRTSFTPKHSHKRSPLMNDNNTFTVVQFKHVSEVVLRQQYLLD